MNQMIETIKSTRLYLLQLANDLSLEQLNEVPPGFNNNIIWNLAHLVAAQQGVCYLRAGLPTSIDESFYQRYKPGTKPEATLDSSEVEFIKAILFSSLDTFVADYKAGLFANYMAWTTRYGVPLQSIQDAVQFLLFHEGLHTGYIMALKRVVKPVPPAS